MSKPLNDITIRKALSDDKYRIEALLRLNNLSTADILASSTLYFIAVDNSNNLLGTIGLEIGSCSGLLRSAAVHPHHHSRGIGTALTEELFTSAIQAGLKTIYLFSTGAGNFWKRFHFKNVPVAEVAAALPGSHQVKEYLQDGSLQTEVAWSLDLCSEFFPER